MYVHTCKGTYEHLKLRLISVNAGKAESVPLKALAIGRHPSLAQGAPATRGSEAAQGDGVRGHSDRVRIPTNPVRIPIASASLPHHSDRSRLGVRASFRRDARAEDCHESEYEPREPDQEAAGEDQDRRSARRRGWAVLRVEELGRGRHGGERQGEKGKP